MEDVVVTKMWMYGIVGLMVVYGIFAFIGVSRKKARENK